MGKLSRRELMYAARKKFDDPRIALVEVDGEFSFRAYTGVNFTVRWEGDVEVVREVQVIYWRGKTLEEAAKATEGESNAPKEDNVSKAR